MLELWQTEWCPASRRIRQRLTELGIDYIATRYRSSASSGRCSRERTGSDTIPVLVTTGGDIVGGEQAITAYLDTQIPEPPEAHAHQLKAEKARRRYLQEECECSQPATP